MAVFQFQDIPTSHQPTGEVLEKSSPRNLPLAFKLLARRARPNIQSFGFERSSNADSVQLFTFVPHLPDPIVWLSELEQALALSLNLLESTHERNHNVGRGLFIRVR